jgi:hypothetical protein
MTTHDENTDRLNASEVVPSEQMVFETDSQDDVDSTSSILKSRFEEPENKKVCCIIQLNENVYLRDFLALILLKFVLDVALFFINVWLP